MIWVAIVCCCQQPFGHIVSHIVNFFTDKFSTVKYLQVKPVLSGHSKIKRPKIGFQDLVLLNAYQKYCRMLQGEHSAILSTFINLQFVIKIFVLSVFEWPLKTGFTVHFNIGHQYRSWKNKQMREQTSIVVKGRKRVK